MKKLILFILMSLILIIPLKADEADPPTEKEQITESQNQEENNSKGNSNQTEENNNQIQSQNKSGEDTATSSPITLKSKSGIIIEASTKKVLFESASNERMAPASMTKIMTMLLIMEEIEKGKLSLDDEVTISKTAAEMGGSQIYLEENSKATVKELLTAIGIGSANDAAVAMAEKIGGSVENFVNLMNEKAKELGCKNTHFSNPHGLDEEEHYSSAYDMAIIAAELVKHESILDITGTYETTITHQNGKSIWLVNTNSLIRFYSGLDGLKTGYTDNAGYCLTGTMERNDMRLITVVMNAEQKEDRNTDTINMMEYAFSMFYKNVIISKDKSLGELFIDNSKERTIKYYLEEDVSVVLGKDTDNIKYKYDIDLDEVEAPLKSGDKVGKLTLRYDGLVKEYNLIVKEDIKEAGFFGRMFNYLKDILSGNVNVIN